MSTYEEEHNITPQSKRRVDNHERHHSTLASVINTFLTDENREGSGILGNVFESALRQMSSESGSSIILQLLNDIGESGQGLDGSGGVTDDFLDSLERVDIQQIPDIQNAQCPICTNKFVDDEYPLIVKLPCQVQLDGKNKTKARAHVFDLECIGPWLKMNPTCPICRFNVAEAGKKRKEKLEEELKNAEDEEEEDDGWELYG